MERLHKAFGAEVVLKGVDLEIGSGEMAAIVGESGCGKTVLLNHVLGQLTPDAGRVRVADHTMRGAPLRDLAALSPEELDAIHAHWGVVFQRNALFSGSVYGNIALWLDEVKQLEEGAIRRVARQVLASVGLPTDDRFLERDQSELSGGMAKRLAVARALSMDPVVVFYDEPTTGLDPSSAIQVHDLILDTHRQEGRKGGPRTTLIITHDKDLLRRLRPRTVMLHDGGVFFDGRFERFEASDSTIIRPYFDLMPRLHARRFSAD